jgi:hypothetical protein
MSNWQTAISNLQKMKNEKFNLVSQQGQSIANGK